MATTDKSASSLTPVTDQNISDAYVYLLDRLLILRQQQLDFREGFKWNTLVHRKPGGVDWPNPNLDVAYSEAWVAVDEKSCLIVTVPSISGRYYTVQFLNGWGETVANINEHAFPQHPNGNFAVCLKGGKVSVPAGAQLVEVPVKYMRVLLRVELGTNWDAAVALQRKFEFRATGQPILPTLPETPIFDTEALPATMGVYGRNWLLRTTGASGPTPSTRSSTTRHSSTRAGGSCAEIMRAPCTSRKSSYRHSTQPISGP
jgi:hypothetical protein